MGLANLVVARAEAVDLVEDFEILILEELITWRKKFAQTVSMITH